MDTVERSSVVPVDQAYDGFISYSHAADGLLAPRLQSALQRFAKPWWKRRAVRIFRDESSLSANPHLWSSITEALDSSGWFVLLLSPDAAESEWVNQEIAYWVEHRDPAKILPVLTDGDFGWFDGDVNGDAAPESLRGAFSEEPRWVDLRGVDSETELDLQNPEWAAAVADIASTIRGIPKDELASEEVRQHRRTVRTAWAAGAALAALAVVAAWASIQSSQNAAQADQEAARAVAAEQDALTLADIAEAGRLVASAATVLEDDAQLAMLLLLLAYESAPEGESRQEVVEALADAAVANRLLWRSEVSPGDNRAALSTDGSTVYLLSQADMGLISIDRRTDAKQTLYEAADAGALTGELAVSPRGDTIAVGISHPRGVPGVAIEILHAADGAGIHSLSSEGCPFMGIRFGYSPDGRYFWATNGTAECPNDDGLGGDPASDWVEVYDTSTWEEVRSLTVDGARSESLAFSQDGNRVLVNWGPSPAGAELRSFPALDVLESLRPRFTTLAPNGRTVVRDTESGITNTLIKPEILDVVSGDTETIDLRYELTWEVPDPFRFSPDASLLSIVGHGQDVLVDSDDGSIDIRLYGTDVTYVASWSDDGNELLTVHESDLRLWAIVQDPNRLPRDGDWVGFARDSLVRGFTGTECFIYRIDPCSTLEEMRSR